MPATVPVTVVIPTIGRPSLLARCLSSLAACNPRPAQVVVVDQSQGGAIRRVVEQSSLRVDVVESDRVGRSIARNAGWRAAGFDVVLSTDDDCTVDGAWAGTAFRCVSRDRGAIVSGVVRPAGDAARVPALTYELARRDFTGERRFDVLATGNMACDRDRLLAFGGFDERLTGTAEDNDLCYRWLKAGRRVYFEPDLIVWHHDWRSNDELEQLYVEYAIGQGTMFGKHLREGDLGVLRFVARDLYKGFRSYSPPRRRRAREIGAPDPKRQILRGLPRGLMRGLRLAPGIRATSSETTRSPPAAVPMEDAEQP